MKMAILMKGSGKIIYFMVMELWNGRKADTLGNGGTGKCTDLELTFGWKSKAKANI